MNKQLQDNLSILESLIETQKQSVVEGGPGVSYMHGMANGMIMAHSIFADNTPGFVIRPRRAYNLNIRHKTAQLKRKRK
jgi:hypothetical protein